MALPNSCCDNLEKFLKSFEAQFFILYNWDKNSKFIGLLLSNLIKE